MWHYRYAHLAFYAVIYIIIDKFTSKFNGVSDPLREEIWIQSAKFVFREFSESYNIFDYECVVIILFE